MRISRHWPGVVALISGAAVASAAASQPVTPSASAPARTSSGPTVALMKVVSRLQPGARWATIGVGFFCNTRKMLDWSGDAGAWKPQTFRPAFRDEMHRAGVRTLGDSLDLFATESDNVSEPDYAVGALIGSMDLHVCYPNPDGRSLDKAKGDGSMSMEWQIYSRLQHQVVARIETSATFKERTAVQGGLMHLLSGVFAENAKQLAASPEFRKLVEPRVQTSEASPQPSAPIAVAADSRAVPLAEALKSVVLVYGGGGQGSGFLLSRDGYVVTDQHVVGGANEVKVRWPDGVETVGEVVRRSRPRDVALIKTDARGRNPLPLRRIPLQPGETVVVIAAPLGKDFQGTVTRGTYSAERTLDGVAYLQSDVHVAPGSSGGPMLDDQGRVIGLVEAAALYPVVIKAQFRGEAPSDVNLFIPIGEAAKALGLKLN